MLLYAMPLCGMLQQHLLISHRHQLLKLVQLHRLRCCLQAGGGCNDHFPGRHGHDCTAFIHFWGPRHQQAGPCPRHHAGQPALHAQLLVLDMRNTADLLRTVSELGLSR